MDKSDFGKQRYKEMVDIVSPNSNIVANCFKAFVVGGLICVFAEFIKVGLTGDKFTKDEVSLIINIVLIGLTAILTGFGIFNKIGKFSGAGTFVPITGFANAMVAPAIEFKKEGWVFGMAAKMFIVAGPVIVYGLVTSSAVGLIYYFFQEVAK